MKKRLFALGITAIIALATAGCGNSKNSGDTGGGEKINLTMTCVGTDQGIDYITSVRFAETVAQKSDGAINIKVYGADQLAGGATNKALEMLATGQADIGVYSNSVLSNICANVGVTSLPWVFSSYEEVNEKMLGAAGKYCEEQLDAIGITWLDYTHNALRQISNNKRTVRTPEDVRGLKIRIPGGNVFNDTWRALGADPIAMAWSEVFTALQQGTIDGQENGVKTSQSNSIQEVNKYFTVWNYAYDPYPILFNKARWEELTDEQRTIIKEAANEVCEWSRDWVESEEEELLDFFRESGVEITILSEDEIEAFRNIVEPVIENYKEVFGEEAYAAFGIEY